MSEFGRDLRFGLRLLARSPVFTATAALLLAIGISANTLIFSVVDALLLRPLPVIAPERLVRLIELHPTNFVTGELPYGLCEAMASKAVSFSEVFCEGDADLAFSDGANTERERVHLVSANFFSSLGVQAYLGRVLNSDDDRMAAMNAVLSYDFWDRHFRRDPAILGRSFTLRGHAITVVGVLPRGFNGVTVDTSPDIRVPASLDRFLIESIPDSRTGVRPLFAQIFGRLRPGIARERAEAEVETSLRPAYTDLLDHKKPAVSKVIVNQAFAGRFFRGQNPIGARFGFAGPNGLAKPDDEVVGVVSDAKYRSLGEPVPPTVYSPVVKGFDSGFILHVRTLRHPEAIIGPVREALRSLDPQLPFIEVRTLREEVETSLWQERLLAALSSIFGGIAALLASIGLYGTLDYRVKSRTREIGVRIALGAEPGRIARLLVRETIVLITLGVVAGVVSYAGSAAWIRQVLYDVRPWEPSALLAALLVIAGKAILAAAPPIWRGVRTDPSTALRVD